MHRPGLDRWPAQPTLRIRPGLWWSRPHNAREGALPSLLVVASPPVGIAEDGVRREGTLQLVVGSPCLRLVLQGPGVWMMPAKQATEGTADLGLGCARVEAQDGVQVGGLVTHDSGALGWGPAAFTVPAVSRSCR
jgi:hypothetical protein